MDRISARTGPSVDNFHGLWARGINVPVNHESPSDLVGVSPNWVHCCQPGVGHEEFLELYADQFQPQVAGAQIQWPIAISGWLTALPGISVGRFYYRESMECDWCWV